MLQILDSLSLTFTAYLYLLLLWVIFVINVSCNIGWERADHLALLYVMFHFHMWCPVSGVVLDCIDSRYLLLSYFEI